MDKIGLFWGSDTGVTEEIVGVLIDLIGKEKIDSINVFHATTTLMSQYSHLILGLSTWYDGDLQSDWEAFFDQFQTIDFAAKQVAIFGLGDQEGYGEFFVDGIGMIGLVVEQNGGQLLGKWPVDSYSFEASKGVGTDGLLMGLAIDEDNQPELTDKRLSAWVEQLKTEGFFDKK